MTLISQQWVVHGYVTVLALISGAVGRITQSNTISGLEELANEVDTQIQTPFSHVRGINVQNLS